jgi:hypothetical protein
MKKLLIPLLALLLSSCNRPSPKLIQQIPDSCLFIRYIDNIPDTINLCADTGFSTIRAGDSLRIKASLGQPYIDSSSGALKRMIDVKTKYHKTFPGPYYHISKKEYQRQIDHLGIMVDMRNYVDTTMAGKQWDSIENHYKFAGKDYSHIRWGEPVGKIIIDSNSVGLILDTDENLHPTREASARITKYLMDEIEPRYTKHQLDSAYRKGIRDGRKRMDMPIEKPISGLLDTASFRKFASSGGGGITSLTGDITSARGFTPYNPLSFHIFHLW